MSRRIISVAIIVAACSFVAVAQNQVTINYNSRSGGMTIPAGMIAAQKSSATATGLSVLHQASYRLTRIDSTFSTVFANGPSNPNWQAFDDNVRTIKGAGFTPLIVVDYAPGYLQFSGCKTGSRTAPNNLNAWADLAARLVRHMDVTFPGLATYYEIWNEPNVTFCYPPNDTTSGRVSYYTAMYGTAAAAMRKQSVSDQSTVAGAKPIKIGGPATSDVGSTLQYLPVLLSDTTAAPNVNFVSYHKYPAGAYDISHGELWDKVSSSGDRSLYSRLQDSTGGIAASYISVSNAVRKGSQPSPSTTPILVTEYNGNWSASNDCCRNSPTYSPLLNSLWMIDQLNVAYKGYREPAVMMYFAASAASLHDCLVGLIDSAMDCSSMASQPYPQLRTYMLIAASNYLNMNAGGHMATSVSATSPLAATGFYTGAGIAALITNPFSSNITFTLTLQHPGGTATSATLYLLNKSNPSITASTISFSPSSTGLTAHLTIPGYSVMGVKLK